jgi:UDP-N-acetylmuramoyl-tripeptide--D-alanyl-D-alanine ligase
MKPIPLSELARRFEGTLHGEGAPVSHFATDSREVQPGSLFVAITGGRVDGHSFVEEVRSKGAVASLVERPVEGPHILVSNVVDALANLGRSYRREFVGPVVGITGSAGKTTTKEMVAAALSPLGLVLATVGNRNTEFTAPLLWSESNTGKFRAAVIEMGMRGFGQIAHLASFSFPQIGLITNIGWSHLELVGDRKGIARAKAELLEALPKDGLAIAPHEDDFVALLRSQAACEVATFGFSGDATARVTDYLPLPDWRARARVTLGGESVEVELPGGKHLALNAAAALLASRRAGVKLSEAAEALRTMKMPPMRNDMRKFGNQIWVLDMYNSAPNSARSSLEMVHERAGDRPIVAVLGEMRELGSESLSQHRELGRLCAELGVKILIGIDSEATRSDPGAELPARAMVEAAAGIEAHYAADHAAARQLLESIPGNAIVLVKGSRAVALEKVVPAEVLAIGSVF